MTIARSLWKAFGRLGGSAGTRNRSSRVDWLSSTLRHIPGGSRILDAGCGEQQFKPFCSHLSYVGQDFAQYDGKGDGKGLQTGTWDQSRLDIVCDITAIPELDGSFDAVMCTEVLEHVPDPVAALEELCRLVKPNGQMILTAPFCSLSHYAPFHFSTGFNRYWYEWHLNRLGYDIVDLQQNGSFFEYLAQEIRRTPMVAARNSSKAAGYICGAAFALLSLPLILLLGALSRQNDGTADLLCFGYHVLAQRRSPECSGVTA